MGEKTAERYFARQGIDLRRFTKEEIGATKTPDFRAWKGEEFCFYVEVKTVAEDRWLEDQLKDAPPGTLVGGTCDDPIYNRLSKKVYEATGQFRAVNAAGEYPNVLVFVNRDDMCGYGDLLSVLTGQFFTETGKAHPIYMKYSRGRLRKRMNDIDLFVWIDMNGHTNRLFNSVHQARTARLTSCLGIDLKEVPNLFEAHRGNGG